MGSCSHRVRLLCATFTAVRVITVEDNDDWKVVHFLRQWKIVYVFIFGCFREKWDEYERCCLNLNFHFSPVELSVSVSSFARTEWHIFLRIFWLRCLCMDEMNSAQLTVSLLDVEFDQILVDLKPYVIKIQQQSGWFWSVSLATQSYIIVNTVIICLVTYRLCWCFFFRLVKDVVTCQTWNIYLQPIIISCWFCWLFVCHFVSFHSNISVLWQMFFILCICVLILGKFYIFKSKWDDGCVIYRETEMCFVDKEVMWTCCDWQWSKVIIL